MSVIREHKLLLILVVISLLVIVAGVLVIKKSNRAAENQAQQQAQQQAQIHSLNKIAEQAQAQLVATAANTDVPIEDVKPEASVARAKALEGKTPDVGSDDWCELMMAKNADDWTEEERSQFAQHCI